MEPRKQVAVTDFDKFMNVKVEIQFQDYERNQLVTDTGEIVSARLINNHWVIDSSFACASNNIFIVYFVNDSNQETSIIFEYVNYIQIV